MDVGTQSNEIPWEREGRDLNFFSPVGMFRNTRWLKSARPFLTHHVAALIQLPTFLLEYLFSEEV